MIMGLNMTDYTSVKVPKRLAELVTDSKYFKDYGFTSVSSYVLFATRELLRSTREK